MTALTCDLFIVIAVMCRIRLLQANEVDFLEAVRHIIKADICIDYRCQDADVQREYEDAMKDNLNHHIDDDDSKSEGPQ